MLKSLHISNYALIDGIDIDFCDGLNVITGETGAGKSIILGALSLILGGRADSRVVTDTSRKSVIEAVFSVKGYNDLKALCTANDIDWDDNTDDAFIMRREITPSGRSRAFINDTPVTVALLREVAMKLVDIHSQHQNLLLASPEFQLSIIDSLAGNGPLLQEYTSRYNSFRDDLKQLKRHKAAVEKSRDDEEFLRYQLEKLDALNLQPGEQDELEREREIQAGITGIKEHLIGALNNLTDGNPNALSLLEQTREHCDALSSLLKADDRVAERLESVIVELRDIAETLSDIDSNLDADPDALDCIDARLNELAEMQRRHKVGSVDELIELRDGMRNRLDLLENGDEQMAELEKAARRSLALAKETAAKLSEARQRRSEKLAADLKERALPLGMKNMQCEIAVRRGELSPTGADTVEFLFAFNKNQQLLPVGNTASGGEISRLMLSIKAIIAEHIKMPSLILDEIDTGVSGDVANRMGELMLAISRYSQVIVITHLPQVAAKGSSHFKVFKEDDETSTHTRIRRLTDEQRIDELALMLSGNPNTEGARANAIELLSNK